MKSSTLILFCVCSFSASLFCSTALLYGLSFATKFVHRLLFHDQSSFVLEQNDYAMRKEFSLVSLLRCILDKQQHSLAKKTLLMVILATLR